MPANRASLQITEAYRGKMVALRERAQHDAREVWGRIDQRDLDGTYEVGLLAVLVTAMQREAARLSSGYLQAFIQSELGRSIRAPMVDARQVGQARNGDELRKALVSPLITAKVAIRDGKTPTEALVNGRTALDRMVGLATDTAARESLRRGMEDSPYVIGWQRAVKGTCGACMGAAKGTEKDSKPLGIHPNCQCVSEPNIDLARKKWLWDDAETRFGVESRTQRPDWERDLTPGEIGALNNYTGGGWRTLNEKLQDVGDEVHPPVPLTADEQELMGLLDSAIQKAGGFADPPTVWRGVKLHGTGLDRRQLAGLMGEERREAVMRMVADWAEQTYKPGNILQPKGFQSTSFDVPPALNGAVGAEDPGIIFEIQARTGALLEGRLTVFDDEAELLQGRNTRYRVRKVLRDVEFDQGDGDPIHRTVVQLVEL